MLNKRYFVLVFTVALACFFISFVSASTPGNIASCQTLDTAGNYSLTTNLNESWVNSTGCFNITTSNVQLDCAGFFIRNQSINSTNMFISAIYAQYVSNITIRNCNISIKGSAVSSAFAGIGVNFIGVNNSFILNSILTNNNVALNLNKSNNNTITNNTAANNVKFGLVTYNPGAVHITFSNYNNISLNNVSHTYGSTGLSGAATEAYGIFEENSQGNNYYKNVVSNSTGTNVGDGGSNGIGIYLTYSVNTTLNANTFIRSTSQVANAGGGGGVGIYMIQSNDTNILNNNISFNYGANDSTAGGDAYGFYGYGDKNIRFINNTIHRTYGGFGTFAGWGAGYGFYIENSPSSSNFTVANNSFVANGETVRLFGLHSSYFYYNNYTDSNSSSSTSGAIYVSSSQNNTFIGGTVNASTTHLIYLTGSATGNIFYDLTLNASSTKNNTMALSTASNNTFVNVSYNTSQEGVSAGGQIIRAWYYRAQVNDTKGNALNAAVIRAYNRSGSLVNNLSTNTTGFTNISYLIDYVRNGTVNNHYSLYNFSILYNSITSSNRSYNVSIGLNNLSAFFIMDVHSPNLTINAPVDGFNTSARNMTFNFTTVDENATILNCSLIIDSVTVDQNATTRNGTLTNLNASSISGGNHNWNITCLDDSGNSNTTITRVFTVDFTPPNVTNVLFFPNVSDDVDPYKNVTFNATVSDDLVNVSAVILQIRNATAWFNTTMYRFSGNVFQANLTLIPTEQIYSYNIYVNDSFANGNVTINNTFNSSWDCNWNVTPVSLSAITGYFADKYIGNVTIINRGDAAFTNNNCTLNFTTSYSGFSSSYSSIAFNNPSDWASNSRGLQLLSSVTYVNASTNYTLLVNASFPRVSSALQETPTFNVLSNIANTSNSTNNITVTTTVIITPPGPYLYQSITTIPTTIYLTNQSTTFGAYIQNLAGNDTINNTAFNVSFNWTLPSQFSGLTIDGNRSNLYNKLENNSLIFNNITLNFTSGNLASITPASISVRIYSFGYTNATGSLALINHANNATLLISESNITLSCYNVSDSICVSACGNTLDPDCTAPSTSSGGGSSSGGGGGGGSAGGGSSASTSEELQLVRGKQNEIKVTFKNTNGATALTDLSFSLSGKLSKYIAVSPATWDYLGPGESMTLTLKVLSPTYIELGKQNIDVLINGKLGDLQYNEIKSLLLQVQDISPGEAKELIAQDKALIAKLITINLSIDNLNKLLNESETGLANFNYAKIIENHATIEKNVNAAIDASKIIRDIQALISDSKSRGISTTGSERLIKLAELSLQRGDYEDAISRAKEAQVTYALEVKGEFSTVGYYLKNNTKEIALGVLFLAIFSFGGYKLTELQILNNRIRRLKEEEKILTELIKVLQIETFREKKMDLGEYQQGMLQYEKRIADVIERLIEAENKKANVLHFRGEVQKLKIERDNMVTLVKELQTDYLKKGTIENKVYELKMGSYNKRIAEIDQKMASREAEKALKGLSFFKKDL